MKIEEREEGETVVIAPVGRLDAATAPAFQARVAAIAARGARYVVVDCRRIAYISSAGLRALLIGAKSSIEAESRFAIAGLRPDCRSIVRASGLLSILHHHETVEEAFTTDVRLRAFGDGGRGMEIGERRLDGAVVLSLQGQLDGEGAPILIETIARLVEGGSSRIALECGGMSYINSAGLRALLVGAKQCGEKGGKLVLAALRPECRSVVAMSGFLAIVAHFETCDEAVAVVVRGPG